MRRLLFTALLAVLAACGDSGDAPPDPTSPGTDSNPSLPTVHVVQVKEMLFSPERITIRYGDVIQWVHTGTVGHTVTSGANCTYDGLFDSGYMFGNDTFSVTFDSTGIDTVGTLPYFCIPHCHLGGGMVGWITIEAASP